MSAITVQEEEEYKNGEVLNIDKNDEGDREIKNEEIAPELDVLLKAINFVITKS